MHSAIGPRKKRKFRQRVAKKERISSKGHIQKKLFHQSAVEKNANFNKKGRKTKISTSYCGKTQIRSKEHRKTQELHQKATKNKSKFCQSIEKAR